MEYNGIAGSGGIAIGRVYLYHKEEMVIDENPFSDEKLLALEEEKLKKALDLSAGQIDCIIKKTVVEFSEEEAAIFEAHRLILEDPELIDGIKERILRGGISASNAANQVIQSYVELFSDMEDEYMRERAADVRDVGNRLIRNILGMTEQDITKLDSDVILAAHDLTPSDTAMMDKRHVKGFITNIGGRTSHTAIMARSLDIPAVLGLCSITERIQSGDMVVVDGDDGKVVVNPDEKALLFYQEKMEQRNRMKSELKKTAKLPSVTLDGRHVEIAANIGCPEEAGPVLDFGGEGIGLYRTEFLYMDRDCFPDEEEQFEAYRSVAEKMGEKPVIIRTLDIGGDKKLSYLPVLEEMNPFMGLRAIRLCFQMREMFKTQLKAILRAGCFGNVRIMYPMISGVDEVIEANRILEEAKGELREAGTPYKDNIMRGVMIEIPSAAVTADLIIEEVDFFSIGTNDLCQYTLAADRMNEKISYLYQPFHPAVLRLIQNVIHESHRAGKFTGMCGEMAGDPAAALLLIGMGLDELSMSPSAIPAIKKLVRGISLKEAENVARHALTLASASQIREYCEEKAGITEKAQDQKD